MSKRKKESFLNSSFTYKYHIHYPQIRTHVDSMNPQLCLKALEKALTIGFPPTIRAFGKVA